MRSKKKKFKVFEIVLKIWVCFLRKIWVLLLWITCECCLNVTSFNNFLDNDRKFVLFILGWRFQWSRSPQWYRRRRWRRHATDDWQIEYHTQPFTPECKQKLLLKLRIHMTTVFLQWIQTANKIDSMFDFKKKRKCLPIKTDWDRVSMVNSLMIQRLLQCVRMDWTQFVFLDSLWLHTLHWNLRPAAVFAWNDFNAPIEFWKKKQLHNYLR